MAVKAARVVVATTPTALNSVDTSGITGSGIAGKNMSAVEIFVGGADVSTATGYPVAAGAEFSLDFESSAEIAYAIVATGTAEVAIIAVGA